MNFSPKIAPFQNPEYSDFGQNPVRIPTKRILYFRIHPLKPKACTKNRNPDCIWPKRISENTFLPTNTRGYDEVQNPDFPTLRGRCPPRSRRERHHLPRGLFVSPNRYYRAANQDGAPS
jgi:hypothetical protein